jgi:cyclohexanone monooxygenase
MGNTGLVQQVDALIVGAGFGGIYQLHSLLQLGLNAKVIDRASDVGGTWFWNRYPGAMSDTESYVYRYSWDEDDLQTYPWTHHYVKQPDIMAYLRHVVKRHNLRQHMLFNTELMSAEWDDKQQAWQITTDVGAYFSARYLVTALGLLSRQNYPDIAGMGTFKGRRVHTADWTDDIEYAGKRVGVIGCGSTGIQVITEIAKDVKSLHCFLRHPQYSVPSGDGPVSPEYRQQVNANYSKIMAQVRESKFGFGFKESEAAFESVPEDERDAIFEKLWNQGGGFRFMSGGFSDVRPRTQSIKLP